MKEEKPSQQESGNWKIIIHSRLTTEKKYLNNQLMSPSRIFTEPEQTAFEEKSEQHSLNCSHRWILQHTEAKEAVENPWYLQQPPRTFSHAGQ